MPGGNLEFSMIMSFYVVEPSLNVVDSLAPDSESLVPYIVVYII